MAQSCIVRMHNFATILIHHIFYFTDGDSNLPGGIIAGIVTGAVMLFSILIIVAIVICKKAFVQPMYVYTIIMCIINYFRTT